jgi:Transposase DDE domain group 1
MRRLKTMTAEREPHLTLWNVGSQRIHVAFDGGRVVSDAGLLAVRALEKPLRVIADLAERLPDPRSPKFIHHSAEALLTQQVYQLPAGYPDGNDAQALRDDPLFQILADVSPDAERPLAGPSTLTRFQYAYTRRQAELPPEERPVLLEQRAAQTGRIKILNDYLVDLFVRTRRTPPAEIVLDVDASDDPVHGRQALSGCHGYFEQHQYFPLFVLDGVSGFPLAAWLRPGTVHASCGAVEVPAGLVARLRAAWPGVAIRVRADNGLGVPAVYDFCEQQGLGYAIGYASNPVLQRATATALADVELYYAFYGRRDPFVQRFEEIRDYRAESWPHARRIVAKGERTPQGSQRRFVVTNLPGRPEAVYRDFYVRRGAVPEQPIGELKNGLRAERLSASGFCANAFRLLLHVVAYAIVVLFREATATIPEAATAAVGTLRQRLWKVGAVLVTGARRIWLHVSETWPHRGLWERVQEAVRVFVARLLGTAGRVPAAAEASPM